MKTAVEWLIDKHFGGIENCTPDFRKHIEEALEMEKQQIIEAHAVGRIKECSGINTDGEQYYNETYKK
jgi:hypothetical protein